MQRRGGEHPGLVDDDGRPGARAGTRVVAAGRDAATRGAAWRRCRRASRCPVRAPGLLSPSGRHRTPARCWAWRSLTAAASIRVLPAPAGPTTSTRRSSPATEAAASACNTSRPVALDGRRRCRRVGLGVDRPGDDVLLLGEHRLGGEPSVRSARSTASGHPTSRRRVASGGSKSTQRSSTWSAASLDRRGPAVSRHLRHGTLQVTDRLHDIGPAPRRMLRRHRLDDLGDGQRVRRGTVGGGPLRRRSTSRSTVQPTSAASPRHRVARSATPSPDLRPRVSADASRSRAARSLR